MWEVQKAENTKNYSLNTKINSIGVFLRQYFSIHILKLAFYDFSKIYKGSFLGVVWAFFKPLFSTLIFFLGNVAINGSSFLTETTMAGFGIWMSTIIGMVVWQYLSEGIGSTPSVIMDYSFLVTKMKYKKSRIYFFTNLSKFLQHFVLMIIFFIIYLIIAFSIGADVQLSLIQLPFVALMMVIFFFCWTMFIAPLCVVSRDVKELVSLLVMCAFWVSGTFFDPNTLISDSSSGIQKVIYQLVTINPLATFVSIFKSSFFGFTNNISANGISPSEFEWFFEGQFSNGFFIGYWYKFVWVGIWSLIFVVGGIVISKKTKTWINDLL